MARFCEKAKSKIARSARTVSRVTVDSQTCQTHITSCNLTHAHLTSSLAWPFRRYRHSLFVLVRAPTAPGRPWTCSETSAMPTSSYLVRLFWRPVLVIPGIFHMAGSSSLSHMLHVHVCVIARLTKIITTTCPLLPPDACILCAVVNLP